MLFSSLEFIFIFLPVTLAGYFLIPKSNIALKNLFLLLVSLTFYAYGEPKFVFVMLLSIAVNYICGTVIDNYRGAAKLCLALNVIFNIGTLFIFKYLNFFINNINRTFGREILEQTTIVLPIGISFFTFQAMSYVVDVYRKETEVQKNPLYLALYVSFFPQLIAGPIVRYTDVNREIRERKVTFEGFSYGCRRFIVGFSKKILLSNNLALVADKAFELSSSDEITFMFAWLGILSYTLQIFFDFSGYSDMAIGLGEMFGFHFNENFNYPYISKSVSEFWRRWHMSLGSWFRDYVYIPLGGSRVKSRVILLRNLFVVWFLTGVWHGASWNFIVWGLMYFMLLSFEKLTGYPGKLKCRYQRKLYQIFTLMMIIAGWVVFRANGLKASMEYLVSLINIGTIGISNNLSTEYFWENIVWLLVGIVCSTPLFAKLKEKRSSLVEGIEVIFCMILFVVSISYLVVGAYNPFIYFNF